MGSRPHCSAREARALPLHDQRDEDVAQCLLPVDHVKRLRGDAALHLLQPSPAHLRDVHANTDRDHRGTVVVVDQTH